MTGQVHGDIERGSTVPAGPGPGYIFDLVRRGRARTRGEILEATGLARMTVSQRVDALLAANLLREGGTDQSARGRRPRRLEFNVQHSVVAAAAVDTTHTRTALTALDGTILADVDVDVDVTDGPESVLPVVTSAIQGLLERTGTTLSQLSGIGICVPGPIEPLTSRPSQPPIMPGWDAYPIIEHVQGVLDVPVLVENDANAMAIGEYSAGYEDSGSICVVKVSTGIGVGIVVDGRVYQGIDGGAGDIGHVRLPGHPDALCQCGARGCLAAVASGRAVATSLGAAGIEAHSGRDVGALLARGDVETVNRTRDAGRVIGEVMASMVCLLNPGVLLMGGALASSPLISGVRETLYPNSPPRATRSLDVGLASLGENAEIVGMTRTVVDHIFSPRAVDALLAE